MQEEREEFGEATEKFVTSSYVKRKKARKQWEVEEARRAIVEARNDVTKKDSMTSFYSNMLVKLTDDRAGQEEEEEEEKKEEAAPTPPASPSSATASAAASSSARAAVKEEEKGRDKKTHS